jgi:light-regulated signal transduction histidine kinase (bacteriophytochrome)
MDLAVSEMVLGDRRLFVGIIHDATDRVRAETEIRERSAALEATNAELETFAYSVSHDLRAPLQSMVGFSEELLERHSESLDETAVDYLQRIHTASLDMGHLIDGLLGLSQATRGALATEEVDLSALAESVVDALVEGDPSRDTDIEIEPKLVARTDPGLIRSVLENLLGNAWKFTSKRARGVRIRFGALEEDGATAYFVEDNGVGLDMADVDGLFTPFHRLHAQEGFPGTGIGLATVDRIIQRHGGRVWVRAEPGEGATFYFTLNSPTESGPVPA